MKLCIIITASQNLYSLYRGQFLFLKEAGIEVTAIASPGVEHEMLRAQGIHTVEIPMCRGNPPIFKDLYSLFLIWKHLLLNRYDIVSVSTPKASFLGALASLLSFHTKVIFTLRGRAYENKNGVIKKAYMLIDKIICLIATKVFCISKEIREDFIKTGLVNKNKIFVIGEGSSNGVDLSKFTRTKVLEKNAIKIRNRLSIPIGEVVILYSGRIRRDKGINELVKAYEILLRKGVKSHLVIQGEFEDIDPIAGEVRSLIESIPTIHIESWSLCVEEYFAMADIFAFPSHREGFGNVAIEASAMRLPIVAFDVVGCRESVLDKVTGYLIEPFSVEKYSNSLELLILDYQKRTEMGRKGRLRIVESFDSKVIWNEILNVYRNL